MGAFSIASVKKLTKYFVAGLHLRWRFNPTKVHSGIFRAGIDFAHQLKAALSGTALTNGLNKMLSQARVRHSLRTSRPLLCSGRPRVQIPRVLLPPQTSIYCGQCAILTPRGCASSSDGAFCYACPLFLVDTVNLGVNNPQQEVRARTSAHNGQESDP